MTSYTFYLLLSSQVSITRRRPQIGYVQRISAPFECPGTVSRTPYRILRNAIWPRVHVYLVFRFEMVDEEAETWLDVSSLLFDDAGSSKPAGAQLELPTWDYNYESHVPLPVVSSGVPLDYRVQVWYISMYIANKRERACTSIMCFHSFLLPFFYNSVIVETQQKLVCRPQWLLHIST